MSVFIHKTADVEKGANIGDGTKIWHLCHIRTGANIGKNCVLGRNVYVESGAEIGHRVHIQNNVSVYDGVKLGNDVFVGPSAVFTNDKYPRANSGDKWQRTPTVVCKNASIGAGAVIVCGVTIGAYAMIGAGAVVSRDIACYEIIKGINEHVAFTKDGRKCSRFSVQK